MQAFRNFFELRGGDSIQFKGCPDNPAFVHYERIVKRLGGERIGLIKRAMKLSDGKFYDDVLFQITKENYFAFKKKCSESKKHTNTGSIETTIIGAKSGTGESIFESKSPHSSASYPAIGRGGGLNFLN